MIHRRYSHEQLKTAWEKSGMSMSALGRQVQLNKSTLSRLFSGKRTNIGYVSYKKIIIALGANLVGITPEGNYGSEAVLNFEQTIFFSEVWLLVRVSRLMPSLTQSEIDVLLPSLLNNQRKLQLTSDVGDEKVAALVELSKTR